MGVTAAYDGSGADQAATTCMKPARTTDLARCSVDMNDGQNKSITPIIHEYFTAVSQVTASASRGAAAGRGGGGTFFLCLRTSIPPYV
jgi:hypothetical protein